MLCVAITRAGKSVTHMAKLNLGSDTRATYIRPPLTNRVSSAGRPVQPKYPVWAAASLAWSVGCGTAAESVNTATTGSTSSSAPSVSPPPAPVSSDTSSTTSPVSPVSVTPSPADSVAPTSSSTGPLTGSESSSPTTGIVATDTATTNSPATDAEPGEVGTGTLELTNLTVEDNPNSVLSAYVSWTTTTPATSIVHFGVGDYVWEIRHDALVTEHRVLVIGMRASQVYQLKAMSSNAEGSGEVTGEYTTKPLPDTIPVGEVTAYDPEQAQPGWTLINVQVGDGTYRARSAEPPIAVMYDEEGQPVWYVISGSSPDIGGATSTDLTDVGVLVGPQMQGGASPREFDLAGEIAWQCSDPRCGGTADLSHHANKLPNGHFVVNRDVNNGGVTMPVFEQFAPPENTVAWELDLRAVLPPPQGATGDWCHGNAITVLPEKNEAYVSCRFLGVIKTTYDNPEKIWHLPASYGAEGIGDFTFDPPESQFSDIHDPEIHEDGTIMVFDNGGWAGVLGEYNPTNLKSRVLEYVLDEDAGVATLVWEFPGDFQVDDWYRNSWYQPFWGDADRLENRNVLMTAGMRGPDLRSRVFEATDETGEVVWEMQLPADYGLYRADRVTPPLLRRLK